MNVEDGLHGKGIGTGGFAVRGQDVLVIFHPVRELPPWYESRVICSIFSLLVHGKEWTEAPGEDVVSTIRAASFGYLEWHEIARGC